MYSINREAYAILLSITWLPDLNASVGIPASDKS